MISSYCLSRVHLFILQSSENRSAKKPILVRYTPISADRTRAVSIGSLVPLGEMTAFNRPRTFALIRYHETVCAESH